MLRPEKAGGGTGSRDGGGEMMQNEGRLFISSPFFNQNCDGSLGKKIPANVQPVKSFRVREMGGQV